ncbi:MAG TPA: glycosyltransferase family 1 protein [Opitutus sp.]|nr:glycosyltransferase family 1 protein [Opitutus sp.]
MHILLIGNFAPDRQESMLRFARLLTTGLRRQGHEVSTWSPEPRLVRLLPRYRYGGPAKFVGYFDKFVLFPRRVRKRLGREKCADVVHIIDHANAVYAPLFSGRPLLATCHDLLQIRAARGEFPEHPVSTLGRRYQSWILDNIARLPQVAVPSTETANHLRRLTRISPERVSIIPMSLNHPYRRTAPAAARLVIGRMLRERNLSPGLLEHAGRGFVINVGGGQWYKNRAGLLELYAELRQRLNPAPRLLLVGKPLSSELIDRARHLALTDDLVQVSNVSEAQLQALYSLAEALIFPSLYEGFGWPVAEAQACGCPVFTSNREPMTEVGGAGAAYFDPTSPRAAAQQIADWWEKRPELVAHGLVRSSEWNQSRMIDRYVATYARIAAAQPAPVLA